jgi:heptosyltransferase-2
LLISSDSLALHLGIAQRVPFVAFFAPTSAAEIDDFGLGVKITSTSTDYCSYKKDADNSSLTADRLLEACNESALRWQRTDGRQLGFRGVG